MSDYIPDIRQGDTYRIQLDYKGLDITGYKHWITLKSDFSDKTPALQFESVVGDDPSDDPTKGIAFLDIPPNLTATPEQGKYVWDIQVRFPDGFTEVLLPPKDSFRDKVGVIPKVTAVGATR